MANELARQLGELSFRKLKPLSFRTEIASLSEQELEKHPVRVWVEIEDVSRVLKIAGFARVLRVYPHLSFVYVETYARELASLVASDLVRSVWNDLPVKADGCLVVVQTDPGPLVMAARPDRGTSQGRRCWHRHRPDAPRLSQ